MARGPGGKLVAWSLPLQPPQPTLQFWDFFFNDPQKTSLEWYAGAPGAVRCPLMTLWTCWWDRGTLQARLARRQKGRATPVSPGVAQGQASRRVAQGLLCAPAPNQLVPAACCAVLPGSFHAAGQEKGLAWLGDQGESPWHGAFPASPPNQPTNFGIFFLTR